MIGLICIGHCMLEYAAGKSILCLKEWQHGSSQITFGFLVHVSTVRYITNCYLLGSVKLQ